MKCKNCPTLIGTWNLLGRGGRQGGLSDPTPTNAPVTEKQRQMFYVDEGCKPKFSSVADLKTTSNVLCG